MLPKDLGGRPSSLSVEDIKYSVQLFNRGKVKNAVQCAKTLMDITKKAINPQAVRRGLKKGGLKAKKKQKKPKLTKKHMQNRLDFAIKHKDYTVEDWMKYIFSDESKINRFGSDSMDWVCVPVDEGLTSKTIKPTVKFGGGNIMV